MESRTKLLILSIEIIKILARGHLWMISTTGIGQVPIFLSHKVGLPEAGMTYSRHCWHPAQISLYAPHCVYMPPSPVLKEPSNFGVFFLPTTCGMFSSYHVAQMCRQPGELGSYSPPVTVGCGTLKAQLPCRRLEQIFRLTYPPRVPLGIKQKSPSAGLCQTLYPCLVPFLPPSAPRTVSPFP